MQDESFDGIEAAVRALELPVRQMLAEDLPRQRKALRQALNTGDLASACLEVHAVRGSAAFCKLVALRDTAAALETSLMNNEKNANYTRAFENNIERVLHALEHAKANTG